MSTIKIIRLWTTSLFTSVLSCIPHTLSWSVCAKCFTCNTQSAIHTPSGHQLSVLPRRLTSLLGQETVGTSWKERFLFQGGGGFLLFKVQFYSPSRLQLFLATHSCKLEPNVLYIIHIHKVNAYVHTNPSLLSLLSVWIVLENAVKHEMALLMPSAQMCLAWKSCVPSHQSSCGNGIGEYQDHEWGSLTEVPQLCCFLVHRAMPWVLWKYTCFFFFFFSADTVRQQIKRLVIMTFFPSKTMHLCALQVHWFHWQKITVHRQEMWTVIIFV